MNVFELFAKIGLDDSEYKKGIEGAKGTFSKLTSAVGNGLKTAAKVGGAALAAGTTAIAGLTKLALDGYAEYEQLVGGVETLFGTGGKSLEEYAASVGKTGREALAEWIKLSNAEKIVLENSKEAYKTAGLSMNEYMETVTSFSASLIQSLGGDTELAAQVADRAITDMSDNANKMGTDISMIQNAYQGFAKANYTMLDNLKLGYGGTQEEMKRLVEEASNMTMAQDALGVSVDKSSLSFANIVDAISVVQYNMGIYGTTSKEASDTISGSIDSMKSAWSNFVLGFADQNQNMEDLTNDLVDTVIAVAGNIGPRLLEILPRIVSGASHLISEALPFLTKFIADNGPPLLEAATGLINGLVEQVPVLLQFAIDSVPSLVSAAASVIGNLGNALIELAPELILKIRQMFLETDWQTIGNDISDGLTSIDWGKLVSDLFLTLGTVLGGLGQLLVGLFEDAWNGVAEYFDQWIQDGEDAGTDVVSSILAGILSALSDIGTWLYDNVAEPMIEGILDGFLGAEGAGEDLVGNIKTGISNKWNELVTWFNGILDEIKASILAIYESVRPLIDSIVGAFQSAWEAIKAVWDWVWPYFSYLWEQIKNVFSVVKNILGSYFRLAWEYIKSIWNTVVGYFTAVWESIKGIFSVVKNVLSGNFEEAFDAIKGIFESWGEYFQGLFDEIGNIFSAVTDYFAEVGGEIIDGIKQGINNAWEGLTTWFNNIWDNLFGGRDVDVGVNGSSGGKMGYSHAGGLDYVPYNDYSANLHRGEMVLTASEAAEYRLGRRNGKSGVTIIQNIQAVPQTPAQIAASTQAYWEQARWAF